MRLTDRDSLLTALTSLGEKGWLSTETPYTGAVCDLLLMLGLVNRDAANPAYVVVNGERAQLFIKSMCAHLSDGLPMALDWQTGLEIKAAAQGAVILAEVESLRKNNVVKPTPVREVNAVNALILKRGDDGIFVYMQYDDKARQFQLIGGKVEPEDIDPMHTLQREIQEELNEPNLRLFDHYQLEPLAEHFEKITLSPTFGVVTSYAIRFFHVLGLRFPLPEDAQNRWISVAEIRQGATSDGHKISDLPILFERIWDTLPSSV
jgi:8-oxo-dGTP pyrophosphatase MutT (NUDIX family)